MFFFLLSIYSLSLFFVFFDFNVLFVNEEFLIFICMSILFFLIFSGARKFINFSFFLRIEFIYFFFVYLILLNIKLIEKMLSLVSLENLKLDTLILTELYNFFSESVNELSNSEKLINLFLTKNIVLLINFNIFSSLILPFSSDYFIKYSVLNGKFYQHFELKDINYSFITNKISLDNTSKVLISSSLYDNYISNNNSLEFNSLNNIVDNLELSKAFFIEDLNFFIETGNFTKNFLHSLTK